MSVYHRLPPISRTPSPPAHILRRLQSFGGALSALPEENNPDAATPSTPSTPSPPRKKRKAKKRFLSLGKDPNGKWKKRKLLKEEREIQKALELTVADSDPDDADMLDSINVAGGFLMIGEGSANPRPQEKRKRVVGKRGRPRSRVQPSSERTPQSSKAFVKGPMRFTSSISASDEDTAVRNPTGNTPTHEPTNPTSPATELQSSQPAPPEPPPLLPKPSPQPNEATGLTFHIYKFPDLATSWQITGKDMCPPGATRPSWPTLSLIIQRKLASIINPTTQCVLLNWSFTLSDQPQLDSAIDKLLPHNRTFHDIILIDLDSRGHLPRKIEEIISKSKNHIFWKGHETNQIPHEVTAIIGEKETIVIPDSAPTSPIDSIPETISKSSPPPQPSPVPIAAKYTRALAPAPAPPRVKRKLGEYSPVIKPRPSTSPSTRSRAAPGPAPGSASRWRSGGGVEPQTPGVAEETVTSRKWGTTKRKKTLAAPTVSVEGKVTLAEAMKRQQELRSKGKETGKPKEPTPPEVPYEPEEPYEPKEPHEPKEGGEDIPVQETTKTPVQDAPEAIPLKRPRGRPKGSSSLKPVGVVALAPAPAPAPTGVATAVPVLHFFPPPQRAQPSLQPKPAPPAPPTLPAPPTPPAPPALSATPAIPKPPKEPTREERFKAVVANAVAAVTDTTESRIGNYQRAARSGNDALRAVAEQKLAHADPVIGTQETIQLDEDSGSSYTPSTPGSLSVSTGTDVIEKETQLQLRNEEKDGLQRQRSIETVEAAVTLNAVASEAPLSAPTSEGVRDREEDGQSQSVDIMHGADLLLWAAGAVDPSFGRHIPAATQESAQNATAAKSTSPKPRLKPKIPKEPKEPKIPKATTKAKVPKRTPKNGQRRKSLVVTLKIHSLLSNAETSSTGSPLHLTATESIITSPHTPNYQTASPSVSGFTPVNIPTASIPRPQPYRKPESGTPKLITPKPVMIKPRTSAVDALAAARKQTEQAKSAKSKSAAKGGTTPSPGVNLTSTGTIVPSVPVPIAQAPPKAAPFQVVITPQAIPRPAYAKPGPTEGSGGAEVPDVPEVSEERPPVPADDLPLPSQIIVPPAGHFSTHPVARKFFATFSGSRAQTPEGSDTPSPVVESAAVLNPESAVAPTTGSSSSASVTGSVEKAPETAGFSKFGESADATRQTTPSLGVPRATLTPEYLETKKIMPLVGKGNFLYWEPSISSRQSDVKPLIGDTASSSRSPTEAPPGFTSLAAGVASVSGQAEGRRSYQSPPLRPLSSSTRSTTAPPFQSRPSVQPSPVQSERPKTPTPVLLVKPSDMVFNISRYEQPDQKTVVYGKDILAISTSTPPEEKFSWNKLVKLLEASLQFDDFRESLVVNYHHMAEDEDELNKGLRWYKKDNEVVIAKVDSMGKPPAVLVARVKRERKALREVEDV